MESSPAVTTFAGVLLGLLAFVDLVDLMAPTAAWRDRWEVQAPSRFMAFMALTAYAYIFKHRRTTRFVPLSAEEEKLAGVKTGVVFTWAFFEMIGWFWVSQNSWGHLEEGSSCSRLRGKKHRYILH